MNFDTLIDAKYKALNILKKNKNILALMLNNPDVDMESDEVYETCKNDFYDYSFADDTFQTDRVCIFAEGKIIKRNNEQFNSYVLYIQLLCNKNYVNLKPSIFRGMVGNRNDNLAKEIAKSLDAQDDFGIGNIYCVDISPKAVPNGFTSIMLAFEGVDW